MSDQAIVGLVIGVGGGFLMIFFFLMKMQKVQVSEEVAKVVREIKTFQATVEERLDEMSNQLIALDKAVAVKSLVIEYINKEIDAIRGHLSVSTK